MTWADASAVVAVKWAVTDTGCCMHHVVGVCFCREKKKKSKEEGGEDAAEGAEGAAGNSGPEEQEEESDDEVRNCSSQPETCSSLNNAV